MRVALGLKAHSGWAALVAMGEQNHTFHLIDRCRIELADEADGEWAKQPYHAAEGRPSAEARAIVARGVRTAQRKADDELQRAIVRAAAAGHQVSACAVLVGAPMPNWSVDEILAVHFRMHKAEGALYRDVLLGASERCGVKPVAIPEKELLGEATRVLEEPADACLRALAALGKASGPPWGKDQKDAALAALIALNARRRRK